MIRLRRPLILFCLIAVPAAAGDQPPRSPVVAAISAAAAAPIAPLSELIQALDADGRARALAGLDRLDRAALGAAALAELREAYRLLGRDAGSPAGEAQTIWALAQAGDYSAARAAAERGLKRFPGDPDLLALFHQVKGRTAGVSTGAEPFTPTDSRSEMASSDARPATLAVRVGGRGPASIPSPGDETQAVMNTERTSQRLLELHQAVLSAWEASASAAPMPASAFAPAIERLRVPVQRDLMLIEAAQALAAWLAASRDPQAREALDGISRAMGFPDAARRRELSDELSRVSRLMDAADTAQADADIRDALMGGNAAPEERLAAARRLDELRLAEPDYFKARGAWLNYQGFVQGRLADFPSGARVTSSELGLEPPPGSGLAGIEYETTEDGKLVPVRFTASDGSTRERAGMSGAWSVKGRDGKSLGWSLDAAAFIGGKDAGERMSSIASLSRWLTEQGLKTGLPRSDENYQNDSLASLLSDILLRCGPGRAARIFVDRAQGRIAFDEFLGGAVRQKVARFEPTPRGDGRRELILYERVVKDPTDAETPFRKVAVYRGGSDKKLLMEKSSVHGGALLGTSVELVPALVHYRRVEKGRWSRDGDVQELREQARVFHKSEGLIAGAGETIGIVGRGATDVAASLLAASGGVSLYGARIVPGVSGYAGELQRDWYERASVNLIHNAVSSELGQRYGGDDYRAQIQALNLDERKYIQNVRRELTDQGHPLLGAVTGAGVGVANGMLPLAVGFGVFHKVATLGKTGELAANGVGLMMSGHGGWETGVSIRAFTRARADYDAQDPVSLVHYYTAVQNLTENAAGLPLLLGGLDVSIKARAKAKIPVTVTLESAPAKQPAYDVALDIDPVHLAGIEANPSIFVRRMKIQRLYRKARFIEDTRSRGISEQRVNWMFEKRCPLAFESPKQFRKFRRDLAEAVRASGLPGGKARMKGTSTTFYSENPDKPLGHRFDADPQKPADIDINIEGIGLAERMESAGLSPAKGDNPIFSTFKMMKQFPALKSFSEKWSAELKREVNFVGLSGPAQIDSRDWGL